MSGPCYRKTRWTKKLQADFLDHLAATCNVREAARSVSLTPQSVYRLRRTNAAFSAAWEHALRLGYQMLETRLVGHALAGKGVDTPLACDGHDALDTQLALTLLTTHRNAMAGRAPKGGPKPMLASEAETNAAIFKKLEAMERQKQRADKRA